MPSRWALAVLRLLKEKRLDQGQLAEMAGVTQNTISNIVNDKTVPDLRIMQKVADALKVDLVQLFATEDQATRLTHVGTSLDAIHGDLGQIKRELAELRAQTDKRPFRRAR